MTKTTSTPASLKMQLDETIRPQDDFFGHVNNLWLKANPIPASESRWGSFYVLRNQAWKNMKAIYEEAQALEAKPGSLEQQAGDFYYTGTHTDDYEDTHLQLLKEYLAKIDAVKTADDLAEMIGYLQARGMSGPWRPIIDADDKDSSQHILRLCQGGLTLPDRDYYLEDSEKMASTRKAYKEHLAKMHGFFPELAETEEVFVNTIFEVELAMATISRTRVDLRDVEKNYNKTTYAELKTKYPTINWELYATALEWQPSDQITVDQPEFLAFINEQFTSRPIEDWKTYLKWHWLATYYGRISERFAQIRFEFFGKVLAGTQELLPQWKRAVLNVDDAIGETAARLYVERHFGKEAKQQVLDIVEDLRGAYKKRIENLDWMDAKTKEYAIKKLGNIKVLIGYPDKWRDFSKLKITRDSYIGNIIASEQFNNAYWLEKLHKPTSRDDWFMLPQTVNAYHDPNRLVICFPAAILQAPFFDPAAPLAANMGGIGAVIGHEFTHGFDDQGCQFDAEGNVREWQTDADRKAFHERAKIIIDQADKFEALPGVTMKGKLVIGESIADLGGLEIAYEAFNDRAKNSPDDKKLFFLNFATCECGTAREESLRQQALTDPHPVSPFRVNAMLQHVDEFYALFDVKEGDKLFRPTEKRARIW